MLLDDYRDNLYIEITENIRTYFSNSPKLTNYMQFFFQTHFFGIDNKDNLNQHEPYRDINSFNSGKQGALMRFESHNHNQSPSSNPKPESEKSDTLTKLLQLKDFNGNIINSAVKRSTSGKIRPTTLHKPDISLFVKPESEPGFMCLSKRNIAQDLEYDILPEPIPKVNLVPTQDEKKQPDSNRNPELDREKKLEPVLNPGPDSHDKVESYLNDKTESSPEQEPGLDLDKKQGPDPNHKIEPNLDEKTEPVTVEKLESDSTTETEPIQRSGSDYQFWNPFTITLVTVATSVTVLVILVGSYHCGKVRARFNSSILRDDVQPQIIIPRVRNVHQNPIHSNYA